MPGSAPLEGLFRVRRVYRSVPMLVLLSLSGVCGSASRECTRKHAPILIDCRCACWSRCEGCQVQRLSKAQSDFSKFSTMLVLQLL